MPSTNSITRDQNSAIAHLYGEDETILVAPTGAGKTVICLTAIAELIEERVLRRVIVACPAKVVEELIWPNEAAKWVHLRSLRVLQLQGTSQQRIKQLLSCEAEIIVVSLNNLDWLLAQDHECNGIVIDELSKAAGKQTKALKSKKRSGMIVWRVGMTATPVSQDFQKLYGMTRIIDGGKALGTNKQRYLNTFFYPNYNGYDWTLRGGAATDIMEQIAPLVHLMDDDKAITLPSLRELTKVFEMPPNTRRVYDEMRKEMVVGDVEAANQAVKSGKLRQISGGFIYDNEGNAQKLDQARISAAFNWWSDLAGKPGLIFYEFVEHGEMLDELVPSNIRLAQVQSQTFFFSNPRGRVISQSRRWVGCGGKVRNKPSP